ncbi:non-homologous end joining protein Ku [Streptacidiphilus cavernicola]|uniref:Non-homologous end joining protein Ku n=1 Tax=Streptacidiphilus cavernicola TaxID=3342716 RepID=A0ABV6VQ83_9ACTN
MARAIWTGALSFGLVTVPVGMYSATEDRTTHFHQIQRGTTDRVRIRRVNERTGREVEFGDIVKGYNLGDDQYVVIDPKELEQIAPGRSRVIDVSAFVDLAAVDPVYFTGSYFLAPRGEEFTQIYGLLREALEDSQKVGVANFVMRGKEYLAAIRPAGDVLQLHTLHYADEVRSAAEELPSLPERTKVDHKQLAAARQLIEALSTEWDPDQYRNTFEDRVHELIDAKRAGQEVVSAEAAPEATNVIDLIEALRASLDRAGSSSPAKAADDDDEPAKVTPIKQDAGLDGLSKAELYARATERGIAGRSKMSREELLDALAAPARRSGRKAGAA